MGLYKLWGCPGFDLGTNSCTHAEDVGAPLKKVGIAINAEKQEPALASIAA